MSDAFEQVKRCSERQITDTAPGWLMEYATMGVSWDDYPPHTHEEPDPPAFNPVEGPNLVICTGRGHRLVLQLKDDG